MAGNTPQAYEVVLWRCVSELQAKVCALENQVALPKGEYSVLSRNAEEQLRRIITLEQQVSNQALELHKANELIKFETREAPVFPLKSQVALKSQAAATQAALYAPLRDDTVPMRTDVAAIVTMKAFIERFLAMDDLGLSVPAEVRDDARVALGRARVEG